MRAAVVLVSACLKSQSCLSRASGRGVLVYMRDPLSASRSFSTSSSPLANLASRLSRAQFSNIHTWISLNEVSAHLRKINRFVPTISVETMTFQTDIRTSIGLTLSTAFRRRRSYVVNDRSSASVDRPNEQCMRPSLQPFA